MVWLNGLAVILWTKRSPVRFLVRTHAWVGARSPVRSMREATDQCFSPFLSPFPTLSLKLNQILKREGEESPDLLAVLWEFGEKLQLSAQHLQAPQLRCRWVTSTTPNLIPWVSVNFDGRERSKNPSLLTSLNERSLPREASQWVQTAPGAPEARCSFTEDSGRETCTQPPRAGFPRLRKEDLVIGPLQAPSLTSYWLGTYRPPTSPKDQRQITVKSHILGRLILNEKIRIEGK